MHKALDLDQLNQVAQSGAPLDGVFVTRRWLAQVHHELVSARTGMPALDFDRYARSSLDHVTGMQSAA